jgi:putative ABC transport system ATP-binding protein
VSDQGISESSSTLLEARGIGRRAGSDGAWLLRGVSLSLSAGDRLGLAGPSGAGKTVLLRAMARLDPLGEGEVLWRGETVSGHRVPAFRSEVAYLHQRPAFVEGTVEENLELPFSLKQHRTKRYVREWAVTWLKLMDRDEGFLAKKVYDLSGGESQLVGLLRAIQLDPLVLLLDEPTAAVDRRTASLVEQSIVNWVDDRPHERAIVWVSHDTEQTERICGTILRIHGGQVEGDS